ncbi:hypothetical protein FACS1894217_03150 [Clostridia bacterium]|nr:hypothetical protein FACS1894217_03150 [Clostridia bacterium]
MIYVLDACALIAFLNKEAGDDKVGEVLWGIPQKTCTVVINAVNLSEVYYDTLRRSTPASAKAVFRLLKQAGVVVEDRIDNTFIQEVGRFKTSYKISLADAFALAQAKLSGGTLLTSDHHEFDVIEGREDISFLWIR